MNTDKHDWSVDFLSEKSKHTDPYADELIKGIFENSEGEAMHRLFKSLIVNKDLDKDLEINDILENYFQSDEMPDWADPKLIKAGQDLFAQHAPAISMLLNFKALPLCYSCKNGAKVLYSTGRMNEHNGNTQELARRLMETAQMIMNTMSPHGFDPKRTWNS
jgi:hypothetical protein